MSRVQGNQTPVHASVHARGWWAVAGLTLTSVLCTGCYTVSQGIQQAKLIWKRQPLDTVLAEGTERPERLAKLKVVPRILSFGRERVGLETGKSYTHYIPLEGTSVTTVVQAAEKRALRLKTWWFPIVGSQPYLGYFRREDAQKKRDELKAEGYDTTLGGVQAFSLLGYFPDPLYSSMVDGNSLPELVELLLHECLHLTLYVPNHSAFNENLADFVAKRATAVFLRENPEGEGNVEDTVRDYEQSYVRTLAAQSAFKEFLVAAKAELEAFYLAAESDARLRSDDAAFDAARNAKFDALSERYLIHMAGREQGTGYAHAFRKGAFNNAVLLGYSLYEAKQAPFEKAFAAAGKDVRLFVRNLKSCLEGKHFENEDALWKKVEECRG
ncbi:MAG: aminopeptidase [Silvanigrellales bacterium]|nr:aminopeptidase [Silvanigrellales bacterium]